MLFHPFYWGMWFVAAPVLIHLINMLRHQHVEWAAMEFLLVSQKKHRTWVILKQLLLLLLRMAAIALVVLALGRPLLPDRWGSMFGSQATHHIVLLDDSYSMSEDIGGTTAFSEAKKAISRLGESVVRPREPQYFTLARLSRFGGGNGNTRLDFNKEAVDSKFSERLNEALTSVDVSQTAAEPLPAFEAIRQLLGGDSGERRIVYLFSDYRVRQWDKPDELKKRLTQLGDDRAEIHLIDCVQESGRENLAIASLEPGDDIRAAGVQWRMRVTVRNFGDATARNVPVNWSADKKAGGHVSIPEIAPGHAEHRDFEVNFDVAGEHLIEAHLDADAVDVDNHRYAVVSVPVTTPVLLVDGSHGLRNAKHLAYLWSGHGIQPEIVPPDYLSLPKRPLADFAMIGICNVGKIERSGVAALEEYAKAGGGVFFVAGPLTRADYVTQDLYRKGEGLFPLPLAGLEKLAVDPMDNTPDVRSEDHVVFRNIEHRVEMISKIFVQQYFAVPEGWSARSDASLQVLLRLRPTARDRNGAPLLVEKNFGRGRVMALLTSIAGDWNNWYEGKETAASYGIFVTDLVPYLSHRFGAGETLLVGEPKAETFDVPPFDPEVHFTGPGGAAADTIRGQAGDKEHAARQAVTYEKTSVSGFYQAQLTQPSGKKEDRAFAVNVDAGEGDLHALGGSELASRLYPLSFKFDYASNYDSTLDETQGRDLGDIFLLVLLIVLIVEQWFAWSCSYHVSNKLINPWTPASSGGKGGPA